MACKKSELVSAINSFASARVSNDPNLITFAVKLISDLVDTIDFAPEEEEVTNDDQPE
jgi:hypothetical protein